LWRSRWNVDWQGKPKFSEKSCPSATFVHHKIPHDQTRVWIRAAAVGSLRLTAWAMARPLTVTYYYCDCFWELSAWCQLKEDSKQQKLFSRLSYYYYYLCIIILLIYYYYCHIIISVLLYSYYYIILISCINLDLSHIMYNNPWMK
jgi:hypothetical protein